MPVEAGPAKLPEPWASLWKLNSDDLLDLYGAGAIDEEELAILMRKI